MRTRMRILDKRMGENKTMGIKVEKKEEGNEDGKNVEISFIAGHFNRRFHQLSGLRKEDKKENKSRESRRELPCL